MRAVTGNRQVNLIRSLKEIYLQIFRVGLKADFYKDDAEELHDDVYTNAVLSLSHDFRE